MVSHSSESDPQESRIAYLLGRLYEAVQGVPEERRMALMELLNDDDNHRSTEGVDQAERDE